MSKFFDGLEKYIYWTSIPKIGLNDIVDILIVSVMIYLIVKWIKTTRAWVLLKGIIILLCIAFAAYLLQLHTVSWILSNTMSVGITAILIVFQPELRSALEQLGRKNWVTDIFSTDSRQEELEYTLVYIADEDVLDSLYLKFHPSYTEEMIEGKWTTNPYVKVTK